ncbi:MAG: CdaR family protein [Treponema sp.]|uniref:CdaR family protein n=1 Tax=Treponema sp. TaxID=166 RepID=UPI00298DBB83|nr:CdaR family protein [Treponema sp.]MCI5696923.1 CdaR family protein [Spirochaetia bacterium]MDD5811575.1 CdaR family protein [Treponema sp.]
MKAELILKKITNNWVPKCICLIVAVALYLFGKTARLEKKTFSIPLIVKEDGNLMSAEALPSHISVIIRSEPDNISALNSGDIQAVLDLSYYTKEGQYDVPISASLASGVNLAAPVELTVNPEKIHVKLEERTRKAVPVEVPVYGNPLHGYELKDIKISPQHVIISGPKSLVANINQVSTFEVNLSEKNEDFREIRKVRSINRHIELVSSDNVEVNVSFTTSLVTKTFNNVQVYLVHLAPHLEAVTIPESSFTVSGAQLVLEKFYPSEYTMQADCSMITGPGEYELPVVIAVQDAFKIENSDLTTVKVKIREKTVAVTPVENSTAGNN